MGDGIACMKVRNKNLMHADGHNSSWNRSFSPSLVDPRIHFLLTCVRIKIGA